MVKLLYCEFGGCFGSALSPLSNSQGRMNASRCHHCRPDPAPPSHPEQHRHPPDAQQPEEMNEQMNTRTVSQSGIS